MTEKPLLKNISGIFKAGELTAIMGPSGSGKSTLLNSLACKIKSHKLTGMITANKNPYKFEDFGNFANYVTQEDILMETLTVKETL